MRVTGLSEDQLKLALKRLDVAGLIRRPAPFDPATVYPSQCEQGGGSLAEGGGKKGGVGRAYLSKNHGLQSRGNR